MAAHRYTDAMAVARQLSELYGSEVPRNWLTETERERNQRLPETTRHAEQARDFLAAGDARAARSQIAAALTLLPDDPDLLKPRERFRRLNAG